MTKRCSFVFGGQQYNHFGDSGKEVIAGRAAPERCTAAWVLLWDRGKPRKPRWSWPVVGTLGCTLTAILQSGIQTHEP
jgi:hypothetical protein